MSWKVEYSAEAQRDIRKLDANQRAILMRWIGRNLDGCEDPRATGKALKGNRAGYWRYRVGMYRIICSLEDGRMTVIVVKAGHRRNVYR